MANRPRRGSESTPILYAHGTTGNVILRVDVHPDLKDRIVQLAEDTSWTMKAHITAAIESYLNELGA